MDLNIVCLIGTLTEDAEVKTTKNGKTGIFFSISVERTTEGESDTFAIQYWGKNSDKIAPLMYKGRQLSIKGRLKMDCWQYNGKDCSKLVIIAEDVSLLGYTTDDRGQPDEGLDAEDAFAPEKFDDSDIPF